MFQDKSYFKPPISASPLNFVGLMLFGIFSARRRNLKMEKDDDFRLSFRTLDRLYSGKKRYSCLLEIKACISHCSQAEKSENFARDSMLFSMVSRRVFSRKSRMIQHRSSQSQSCKIYRLFEHVMFIIK